MSVIAPEPIGAAPPVPDSSASEPDFDAAYEAHMAWEGEVLTPGINALAENVYSNALAAESATTVAADKAATATASASIAQSAALAAGAIAWVSGTDYQAGVVRYSLIDFQSYRRKVPGAGTTDPKLDKANWQILGIDPDSIYPFTNNTLLAQLHAIALY